MTNSVHRGSNVLVWGALGFLGQHLVAELLQQGAKVSVLCRPRHLYHAPPWAEQVTWYELNGVDDEITLLSAVSSAELIYNFAGASGAAASNLDPRHSLWSNCAAQLAFLDACEKAGHRPHVVFASSWLVYDVRGSNPIPESHPVAPRSIYAAHKLCIENYLRIFQLRGKITYTVYRISNPYGCDPGKPTKAYKILNAFVRNALSGTPISLFGDGRQLRDFIYISDLTEAFLLSALPEARNETFNISHGISHSLIEAVETIVEIVGRTPVIYKPWPREYQAVEPGSYIADISKAKIRLGFAPKTDLRRGLGETVLQLRSGNSSGLVLRAGV
jgi:UDP-glucose 4-epimerase